MNLILLQPLWHRLDIVGIRAGWFPRALPMHITILYIFLAAPLFGGLYPQYIMFSGIRIWKARPLCEMLPC